jgi:hypothetical protein
MKIIILFALLFSLAVGAKYGVANSCNEQSCCCPDPGRVHQVNRSSNNLQIIISTKGKCSKTSWVLNLGFVGTSGATSFNGENYLITKTLVGYRGQSQKNSICSFVLGQL